MGKDGFRILVFGILLLLVGQAVREGSYEQPVSRELHEETFEQLNEEFNLVDKEEVKLVYEGDTLVEVVDNVSNKRYTFIEEDNVSKDTVAKEIETFTENRENVGLAILDSLGITGVQALGLFMLAVIVGVIVMVMAMGDSVMT